MADGVIMDDNGGVRPPHGNPASPRGIRREEPIGGTQIEMKELTDAATLQHTITQKQIQNVTVTTGASQVVSKNNPYSVIVTGMEASHYPHDVTFTAENNGQDVLVTSTEALVKPKNFIYDTAKNAIINQVTVDGTPYQISGSAKTVVTVTYA